MGDGEDTEAVVEEWHQAYARVTDLARSAGESGLAVAVPATPDWTARDLLAHVIGLGHDVLEGNEPDDHNSGWTQAHVDDRRDRSLEDLLAEWERDHDALIDHLREDPRPLGDVVIHEQDLRGALGVPGARDTDGLRMIRERIADGIGGAVADAGLAPLRLEQSDGDWTWQSSEGRPGVVLRTSGFDLFRAVCTRRTADQLRSWVTEGDVEPYLDSFAGMGPLPTTALDEGELAE